MRSIRLMTLVSSLCLVSTALCHGNSAQEKQVVGKWWVKYYKGMTTADTGDYLELKSSHKYSLIGHQKGEFSVDEHGTWSVNPNPEKWPGYNLTFMVITSCRGKDGKTLATLYGFTGKELINEADAGFSFARKKAVAKSKK